MTSHNGPNAGPTLGGWPTLITLTVEQTAALLGIGRTAAYDAVRRGEIPSLRIGRRVLVPVAKLLHLVGLDAA